MTIEYRYSMKTHQDTYHRVPVLEDQKPSSFSDRTSSTATGANRLGRLTRWNLAIEYRNSMKTHQERHIIESRYSKSKNHRVLATGHQRQVQTLRHVKQLRTRWNLTIEYRNSMKTDQERHMIESRYTRRTKIIEFKRPDISGSHIR